LDKKFNAAFETEKQNNPDLTKIEICKLV